jgi:hypothetical protein
VDDLEFEAGEVLAEAQVGTVAESLVRAGGAGDVEAVGLGERLGSQLAACGSKIMPSPARMVTPPISMSAWATRRTPVCTMVRWRSSSSTAPAMTFGSSVSRTRASRPGFWSRAKLPRLIMVAMVSCPAMSMATPMWTASARVISPLPTRPAISDSTPSPGFSSLSPMSLSR